MDFSHYGRIDYQNNYIDLAYDKILITTPDYINKLSK